MGTTKGGNFRRFSQEGYLRPRANRSQDGPLRSLVELPRTGIIARVLIQVQDKPLGRGGATNHASPLQELAPSIPRHLNLPHAGHDLGFLMSVPQRRGGGAKVTANIVQFGSMHYPIPRIL